jgi:hypothetical protein
VQQIRNSPAKDLHFVFFTGFSTVSMFNYALPSAAAASVKFTRQAETI